VSWEIRKGDGELTFSPKFSGSAEVEVSCRLFDSGVIGAFFSQTYLKYSRF
jgi:hypothetical protein